MNQDVLEKVADVIIDMFGDPGVPITSDTKALDIPGWDSLGHALVIATVEKRFAIQIDSTLVHPVTTIGELVGIVNTALLAAGRDL